MGRKSTIRKLPPELRKEIDRLLIDDRLTLAQIVEHVQKLGGDVSESAVQRYNVQLQEVARDIRMTREMAVAVGRELDAVPDGFNTGRLVVDSLHSLLLKARMQLPTDKVDTNVLKQLASTARDLATAMKANVATEERIAERVKKAAASAAAAVCHERGLAAETVEAVKARILGVRLNPNPHTAAEASG